MATIQELVERIETRLFLASGLDVQTHAEDQIIEMVRSQYNFLFDDHFDIDHTYVMQQTLDGTTGQVTGDLSADILRFQDINCVLWDQDETPLPVLTIGANPSFVRRRCITASSNKTKVFRMVPPDETGPVWIWYRTRLANSVWSDAQYDTEVPLDDEMLILGCVYEFLVNDGSNQIAIGEYKKKFDARVIQQRKKEFMLPMSKTKVNRDGPATRWS